MSVDNSIVFWSLVLTGFSFLLAAIAFMYWADKSGRKSSRSSKK